MTVHRAWFGLVVIVAGGVAYLACPRNELLVAAPPAAQMAKELYAPGEVNTERSRVYIHVGKTGLGHEHAVAGVLKAGHLTLDVAERAGEVVFDMTKFVADPDYARKYIGLQGVSDASTRGKVTANMLGPDVLDVARHSTAIWTISSARATGKQSRRGQPLYEFHGEFTLHGTTRPLRLLAEAEQRDGWFHIVGNFSLLQTDYGIRPFSKAFGAIGVADQLTIYGDLWVASDTTATANARAQAVDQTR
jgi:polyisoprenoid-binding protein YceI